MQTESGDGSRHPKDVLYDKVYDPVTRAWFVELDHYPRLTELLDEAPRFDLLRNLNELNSLFHEVVDRCFDNLGPRADSMVEVVRRYRKHVLWEGQMTPGLFAGNKKIIAAISNKIKRNISMGAVEAVICLEGAIAYGKDKLGLDGQALAEVMKRSLQLCASLALLHDEQEQHRLQFLTGEDGYLKYPDVSFDHVILGGRYKISTAKYEDLGSDDNLQLKFVGNRAHPGPFTSPIRRCPAQRLSHQGKVLNEKLWHLLVEIYHLSGRLG